MWSSTASMDREAIDRIHIREFTKEFVAKCGLNRKNARTVAHQIVTKTPVEVIKQTLTSSGVADVESMLPRLVDAMKNAQLYDEGTQNEPAQDEVMSLQVSGSPSNEEVVMLATTKTKKSTGKGTKAPGRKAPVQEATARGHPALHPEETLGMAMGQLQRHPKPRSMKHKGIDEITWSGALDTAKRNAN